MSICELRHKLLEFGAIFLEYSIQQNNSIALVGITFVSFGSNCDIEVSVIIGFDVVHHWLVYILVIPNVNLTIRHSEYFPCATIGVNVTNGQY